MHEIKSFRIFQTAKVIAVLYAISYAILGGQRPPLMLIIIIPIFGVIFSFIAFAFLCWLYNLIVPYTGGIAFELAPRSEN
jgi:hypothetical protein